MKSFSDLFTSGERYLGTILAIVLVLSAGFGSIHRSRIIESSQIEAHAAGFLESAYSQVSEILGVTTSLAALYRVSGDGGSDQLDSYAEELIGASDSVISVGRFNRIGKDDLSAFAELMSERGIYRFEVSSLNSEGLQGPPADREYYDAVVNISPFTPSSSRLIGVDLSHGADLGHTLNKAIISNKPMLVDYPAGWLGKGDVLLLQPTFAGRYTPDTESSRLQQNDGGYVLDLSFTQLLNSSGIADVQITLPNNRVILPEQYKRSEQRFFKRLFHGEEVQMSLLVGGSSLKVSLAASDGLLWQTLRTALYYMFACLAFIVVVVLLLRGKRYSDYRRKSAQQSLVKEREIALTTLEALNDSVFTVGAGGVITYMNPAASHMVRSTPSQLVGQRLTDSIPFANVQAEHEIVSALNSGFAGGAGSKLKEIELSDEAAATQVDCSFTPFLQEEVATGGVFVMRDVGKERTLNRKLQFLATHDTLTKLANRYLFEMNLEEIVHGALHNNEQHAVCYLDVDQFKIINDTCGHQAGDRLLAQVAEGLLENTRSSDTLARLGGDEFGLLIRNCSEAEAEVLASRLHEFFQTFFFVHGEHRFAVRASIGFVAINQYYESVADVLAAADMACYSAKDKGRNELHVFKAGCAETTQRKGEMMLLPKLQNALEVDKFVLFVQPIAKILPNGIDSTCKYEILLRMEDDDGTLVTPFRLISAAERYDLMKDIDRWVIDRSFRMIAELQEVYQDDLPMFSINLSGQSAVDKDLIGFILSKVAQTGVPTRNICFEITETSAIGDLNKAHGLLDALHELGCELALDDFGAGQCSFGYLQNLPVDYLKVDGQFVKDVDTSAVHAEMLIFVQRVAKLLNIKTVAEFVENDNVLSRLREMGIDYAQGYYISKPFDMKELKNAPGLRKAA